jgi:HlyD family secretion protein
MKKRIVAVVVVLAVVAGVVFWQRYDVRENGSALVLYGNVDIREVELAFRVGGRLDPACGVRGRSSPRGRTR